MSWSRNFGVGLICLIGVIFAVALLFVRPKSEKPILGQSVEELNSSTEDLLEGVVMHFSPRVRGYFESRQTNELNFQQINSVLRDEPAYREILSTYFPGSEPMQTNGGLVGMYLVLLEIGEQGNPIFTVKRVR